MKYNILFYHIFLEPLDCIDVFMRDCKCCDGVSLDKGPQEFLGGLIKTQEASYIDLRNYLFSRQCNLLLKLNRPSPWEVAQRTLDFLHNLIHELSMETLKVCMRCLLSSTVAHVWYFTKHSSN